ncbi:MAG: hypothetical protein H6578_01850 [Chitinophagales bacterium]|nr:hypothetical protein [Chitinophagales bacterium]
MDFTGKVITREELNGRTSGGQPLATIGKMHLQTIFDDGSRLTVESFNFSSGHFGNGPLPNYTSTVQNGYQVGLDGKARPIWALVTPESGMRLNSGALGWKLRLPVYRGIRGGLLIHPDCNTRGTAGCIGIRENDATLIKLGNFFDNYIRVQQRTLIIFHHIPNNPNYGNSGNGINTGKE